MEMYMNSPKSEKAAVKSIMKKLKLGGLDNRQKVRKIEDWVKSEIAVSEELTNDARHC